MKCALKLVKLDDDKCLPYCHKFGPSQVSWGTSVIIAQGKFVMVVVDEGDAKQWSGDDH